MPRGIVSANDADVTAAIVALGVDVEEGIPAGGITNARLAADAVTAAKIAADAVGGSEVAVFVSTEQTGTGAEQNVAHGLAAVPTFVAVYPTDTAPAITGVYTMTEGAHDATNVKVTVTSGKKFKVLAIGVGV